MDRREHWDLAYQTKGPQSVSWFQPRPALSLELIAESGIGRDAGIIDVGGGASTLVDCLLEAGYSPLAVLDLSPQALRLAGQRLGARAAEVEWLEADVTTFAPARHYGLWHDRAVFHFLTDAEDRQRYVATLRRTLPTWGAVIIATFAHDGPSRCSGLDVVRYDEASIASALGDEFTLQEARREIHQAPGGDEQRFAYFRFTREARSSGRRSVSM